MTHQRRVSRADFEGVPMLDLRNIIDSDDEEMVLISDQGWKDDLKFHWNRIKNLIKHQRSSVIIMGVSLLLLGCLSWSNSESSEDELVAPTFDDFFTIESQMKSPLHQIILPSYRKLYPASNKLKDIEEIDLFDFRLGSGLLLLYLQNFLNLNEGSLPMNLKIPFSWRDWIDFPQRLELDDASFIEWLRYHSPDFQNNIEDLQQMDCQTFGMFYGCESSLAFKEACKPISASKDYPYRFHIDKYMDTKIREEGRALLSASYLYHHMPNPERLYLLGINDRNVVLQVDQNYHKKEKVLRSPQMMKYLLEWDSEVTKSKTEDKWTNGLDIASLRKRTDRVLENKGAELLIQDCHEKLRSDRTRIIQLDSIKEGMKMDHWKFEEFDWDDYEFLNQMSKKVITGESKLDSKLFANIIDVEQIKMETGNHPKYFHEANLYDTGEGAHYDWRFFSTSLILNDYRQSIIHRLARTWLRFCFQNGLKTFIAYGSMLGWVDNGLTLPWDSDIDVIVTMESLNALARDFNQTLIFDYTAKDGFQSGMTGYFIDINPTYYSRIKGDGNNAIDGRLIDISTGMYLDITALTWTKGYLQDVVLNDKLKKLIDSDYMMNRFFALEGGDTYEKTLLNQLMQLQNDKKLVHCKNNNVYKIEELKDMIPSYFEGGRAYFPSKYHDIIMRFYSQAQERYHSYHNFKKFLRLWVPETECSASGDKDGELCKSEEIQQEYRLTKDYTQRHLNMIEEANWEELVLDVDSESKPMRIDDFFIDYAQWLDISSEELESIYLA